MVRKLELTGAGCQWLLERWGELRSILEDGLAWQGPDRFKAPRLLGIHRRRCERQRGIAGDSPSVPVLDPETGDAPGELWNEPGPVYVLADTRDPAGGRDLADQKLGNTTDPASARVYLLEIVSLATTRLERRGDWHEEKAELEECLGGDMAALDDSKEGELRHTLRYFARSGCSATSTSCCARRLLNPDRDGAGRPEFRPPMSLSGGRLRVR